MTTGLKALCPTSDNHCNPEELHRAQEAAHQDCTKTGTKRPYSPPTILADIDVFDLIGVAP